MSGRPSNRSRSRSPQRRGMSPSRSPPRRQDERGYGYDRGGAGGYDDRYGRGDDRGGYPPRGDGAYGGYPPRGDDRGGYGGSYGRDDRGGGYGGSRDDRGGGYGGARDDRGGGYSGRDDRGGGYGGSRDDRGGGYGGRDDRGGYGGGRDDRGGGYGGSRDDRGGGYGGGRDDRGGGYGGRDDRGGGRDDRNRGYGDRGGDDRGGRGGGRGDGGGRFGGRGGGGGRFGGRGGGGKFTVPSGPPPEPVVSQLLPPQTDTTFPCRKAFGTHGQPIVVWANHFQVDLKPDQGDIYHYDVVFCFHGETPSQLVRPKEICQKVLNLLIKHLKNEFPDSTVVSDGRRNIYTPSQLPFDNHMYVVTEQFESGKSKQWDVYVKAADPVAIRMGQVQDFFAGRLNFTPYDAIMALDIALRAYANEKYVAVGRNFFNPFGSQSLGEGSELWFGYHQSLRPTQTKFTLNIDMAATTFIQQTSLPSFIMQVLNFRGSSLSFNDSFLKQAARAVKGIKINITHRKIKKEYKITGLTMTSASTTFFTGPDGKDKSVAEYFEETYTRLEHPEWPCALIGPKKKPMYFPIEVCKTIKGQKAVRKETPNQVAAIIKQTCTEPEQRRKKIQEQVSSAHFEADTCLAAFGAYVNPNMLAVQARKLPDPELLYANQTIERPRDGAWNLRGKGFFEGVDLESFAVISLCEQRAERDICSFFSVLVNQLSAVAMKGPRLDPPVLTRQGGQSIESLFGDAINAAEKVYGRPPRVVFCVNPTGDTSNYMYLKRASDVTFGIASQCMLLKHIGKKSPQYIANLLLKVNMKLGGRNSICRNDLPKISECPTIIFGLDVTHPNSIDKSKPSIASAVGSMDKYASHHAACVRKQGHKVEFIEDLESMTNELLRRFYYETNIKPERILVYRDGISEGQFLKVMNKEVDSIRSACIKLDPTYNPPITYVVVQKRHHTRIFPTVESDCDRSGNCKAGTVVDTGICHPTEYDFYLMSHSGLQGCSRPAHYHVLLDEIGFSPDELQTLTYHLCYTFARCTRSVSVVPACFYSHLVAERARLFLEDSSDGGSTIDGNFVESTGRLLEIHRDLDRVMYYL